MVNYWTCFEPQISQKRGSEDPADHGQGSPSGWDGGARGRYRGGCGTSPGREPCRGLFQLTDQLTQALPDRNSTCYGPWVEKFTLAGGLLEAKKRELSLLNLSLAAGQVIGATVACLTHDIVAFKLGISLQGFLSAGAGTDRAGPIRHDPSRGRTVSWEIGEGPAHERLTARFLRRMSIKRSTSWARVSRSVSTAKAAERNKLQSFLTAAGVIDSSNNRLPGAR